MFENLICEFCGECEICPASSFLRCWQNYGDECPFHDRIAEIQEKCNELDNLVEDLAKSVRKIPEPMTRDEYEADRAWKFEHEQPERIAV